MDYPTMMLRLYSYITLIYQYNRDKVLVRELLIPQR